MADRKMIYLDDAIDALAEQIMESALMDNPTTASTDIDRYRPIAELSLRDVPSAQPQKTAGRWIEVDDAYNRISGRCSVCGWESHMYEDDVVGMNYCPNCGAWMEGQDEDD